VALSIANNFMTPDSGAHASRLSVRFPKDNLEDEALYYEDEDTQDALGSTSPSLGFVDLSYGVKSKGSLGTGDNQSSGLDSSASSTKKAGSSVEYNAEASDNSTTQSSGVFYLNGMAIDTKELSGTSVVAVVMQILVQYASSVLGDDESVTNGNLKAQTAAVTAITKKNEDQIAKATEAAQKNAENQGCVACIEDAVLLVVAAAATALTGGAAAFVMGAIAAGIIMAKTALDVSGTVDACNGNVTQANKNFSISGKLDTVLAIVMFVTGVASVGLAALDSVGEVAVEQVSEEAASVSTDAAEDATADAADSTGENATKGAAQGTTKDVAEEATEEAAEKGANSSSGSTNSESSSDSTKADTDTDDSTDAKQEKAKEEYEERQRKLKNLKRASGSVGAGSATRNAVITKVTGDVSAKAKYQMQLDQAIIDYINSLLQLLSSQSQQNQKQQSSDANAYSKEMKGVEAMLATMSSTMTTIAGRM